MRDLALARLTGAAMHFLHLSTAGSVAMVAGAKTPGLPVTAEVAPHHFTLTDAEVAAYDPVFKVNPPLRSQADVDAVKAGARGRGRGRHRHRPRPPRPGEPRRCPSTRRRPGCSAWRRRWALALTELDLPDRAGPGPDVVAAGRDRRPGRRARRAGRGRPPRQPVRDRPGRELGRRSGRPGQPQPQHALRRAELTGRVRHTVFRGEPSSSTGRRSDERAGEGPREASTEAGCWCSPTATIFEGEAIGWLATAAASRPARSCSTPCCPATRR